MMYKYDYIIIGAGAGGSVTASRLSENPHNTVALLEAGSENLNNVSRIQGAFTRVWPTAYNWQYETTPQRALNNRTIFYPLGRIIGGSTAINVGVWLRGSKPDYDEWEKLGACGWNFNLANRLYHIIEDTNYGPNRYRGKGGVMYMEDMETPSPISDCLIRAYIEAGLGTFGDPNGENPFSAARTQSIYEYHRRRSVADAYLSHDIRKRKNLHIIPDTLARKVLFQGNRATGVEYERYGTIACMAANKEVILSAGAVHTPQLLKLSGIGPHKELKRFNIPMVADVPGVGENLQDHLRVHLKVLAPYGVGGSVPVDNSNQGIWEWVWSQNGPSIYYSGNTMGFTSQDGFSRNGRPDYELIMEYNPNVTGEEAAFNDIENAKIRSGYDISIVQLHPASRGKVTLQSGCIYDKPLVDPNYLSSPADMENFIKSFRTISKIVTTPAIKPYTEIIDPPPNASDAEIEQHIRMHAETTFHPVGTTRMGSLRDHMTVVDENLCVRGVSGLRVADASVMPKIIGGHTMAPTILIGERAAEIMAGRINYLY
jgi:choline dehydrogenase